VTDFTFTFFHAGVVCFSNSLWLFILLTYFHWFLFPLILSFFSSSEQNNTRIKIYPWNDARVVENELEGMKIS